MPKMPLYSRRPPVLAHLLDHPSVPITLPRSLPPPTQAGRAATDVWLFDTPAPATSARVWSVAAARLPTFPARLSPTMPSPVQWQLTGACLELEHGWTAQDGWAEVGGQPGMQRRSLVAGVRRKETLMMLLQYYEQFHAVTK